MPKLTREELCALRDKFIMDRNYSSEQHTFMFALLDEQINNYRVPELEANRG